MHDEPRYDQAELRIKKTISELIDALESTSKKNYHTGYYNAQRAYESLRQLLQVDRDLRQSDIDSFQNIK